MTDLASVATADEIATLNPADRAVMVTHALVESKQWLAVATKGTDPTPIAEFKAWAATVAEMTRQKGLAGEIQADALEMVRRAERGIGQAVRNGQEAGEISKFGDGTNRPRTDYVRDGRTVHVGDVPEKTTSSPKDFLGGGQETHEIYAMADGVSDEEFEEVLTEAREEGNLSRANVVRKIKGQGSPQTRDQRADLIAALAAKGQSASQMVAQVGVSEETIRRVARDYDIDMPGERTMSRTRRIDQIRVARETVIALDALASTVALVNDLAGLDPSEAQQWTASLDQSIRALNRLNKKIKETVQ